MGVLSEGINIYHFIREYLCVNSLSQEVRNIVYDRAVLTGIWHFKCGIY